MSEWSNELAAQVEAAGKDRFITTKKAVYMATTVLPAAHAHIKAQDEELEALRKLERATRQIDEALSALDAIRAKRSGHA